MYTKAIILSVLVISIPWKFSIVNSGALALIIQNTESTTPAIQETMETLLGETTTGYQTGTIFPRPGEGITTDSSRDPIFPRPGEKSTTESPREPIFPRPGEGGTTETPREPIFPRPGDESTTESPREPIFPRPGGTTQEPGDVSPRNGSFECIQDLRQYRNDLQERKLYALKMYDSRGKPSSGFLLNFMIRWLGQYDECLKVSTRAEDNRGEPAPFNGRYCLVDIYIDFGYILELNRQNSTRQKANSYEPMLKVLSRGHFKGFPNYLERRGQNLEKITKFKWTRQEEDTPVTSTEATKFLDNVEDLPELNVFTIGLCVPDSCNGENFPDVASREYLCENSCESVNGICEDRLGEGQFIKPKCDYGTDCDDCGPRPAIGDKDILGLLPDIPAAFLLDSSVSVRSIFGVVIHCSDDGKPLSTGAIVLLSIMGVLLLLVVLGSAYDYCCDFKFKSSTSVTKEEVTESSGYLQVFEMTNQISQSLDSRDMIIDETNQSEISFDKDSHSCGENISDNMNKAVYKAKSVIKDFRRKVNNSPEICTEKDFKCNALPKLDLDEGEKNEYSDGDIVIDSETLSEKVVTLNSENPTWERGEIKQKGFLSQILLAFSVRKNTNEIRNPQETMGIPEVNAIYVLSNWWMIFTLCCIATALYSANFMKLLDWLEVVLAQAILNWNIAFDSLLFACALSIAHTTFEELEKKGKINWVLFYLHKIYRMLPVYAAILFFVMYVAEYLVNGPFQYVIEDEARICYDNWWANLLYFNNLYPFPGSTNDICMFWTWFLSLIMQYYLISPILIYTLYKKPFAGFGLIFLCLCVCLGTTAGLSYYYGLTASHFQPRHNDRADPDYDYVLTKPYTRMSPYLVGIVVAFALFKFKRSEKITIPKIVDLFCWAVAITLGGLVNYGLYRTYHGEPLPQIWNVLYMTFAPFAWAIALGWVTFSASAGYSPFVRKFMRWSLWTMLGRMTYVVHIFHPITFLVFYIFGRETLNFLQVYPIIYIFVADVAFSYTYSYLICLLIEYPMIQLEKFIFKDFYLSRLRGIW